MTPGFWHLRNAQGRLPSIRKIRRPHGEADTFEAVIGAGDNLSGPVVARLDFGYGSPDDAANAAVLAAASEMADFLRWAVRTYVFEEKSEGRSKAEALVARIDGEKVGA
jgi:hypothetical protein